MITSWLSTCYKEHTVKRAATFPDILFCFLCFLATPLELRAGESSLMVAPDLLRDIKSQMKYLGARQAVLSTNIANANTPGYKARDILPSSKVRMRQPSISMRLTNPSHIPGKPSRSSAYRETINRDPFETKPDGNTVVLDEQMQFISNTTMDYNADTTLYKKWSNMIKLASQRGGG